MQYHFQKKHVNKYCALVLAQDIHGYLIFFCDLITFIHGTFSRKKFFLAILMQEISRKKFNARNARKTTDKNYLYKEQIV